MNSQTLSGSDPNQSLLLLLNSVYLGEKQQIPNYNLCLTRPRLKPHDLQTKAQTHDLQTKAQTHDLTITPSMCIFVYQNLHVRLWML